MSSRAKALRIAQRFHGAGAYVRGEERAVGFHVEAWRLREEGEEVDAVLAAADAPTAPEAWAELIARLERRAR